MSDPDHPDVLGQWHSSWFDPSAPGGWVIERVTISTANGKLNLVNDTDSGAYLWQGSGELHDGNFFCGMWKSRTHGPRPLGVFSFYVLPQGDAAAGQAFGPDQHGQITRYDWALGKTEASMSVAQQWIAKLPSPAINKQPAQMNLG
jgi:hypothetical protein